MFQPVNSTPEEFQRMEENVHSVMDWTQARMNFLVNSDQVDDATSIYEEFSEWYKKDAEIEVVVVDDCLM